MKESLNDAQALVPERWPHDEETPWVAGEDMILRIYRRFNIKTNNIVTSYREFFSDPRTTNLLIQEKLVKGLLEIIPISSAEAEQGFSQLNLTSTKLRSSLSVSHLSSLMFISINGLLVELWHSKKSTSKGLQKHKSSRDSRTRKCKRATFDELNNVERFFC
eukprot:gene11220-21404_t